MHADLTLTKLRSVKNRTWKARSKWQDIGLELKLEKTDLDTIMKKHGSDANVCFEEMLSMWLKQTEFRPTWSKMIRALKKPAVGFQELAEDIEKNSTTEQSTGPELLQFSHNNVMMEPDEESLMESDVLDGRLKEQTKVIIHEFNVLKHKVFDTLKRYFYEELAEYLEEYCTEKLESLDDVRNFIKRKSSFYDYEIVKYIICLAGAESDKQHLQEYEKHFKAYAQSRVYQSPSTSPMSPDSQLSKLCIRLDSEYDELQCNPVKCKQFQCRLCNLLKIPMNKLVSIEPKEVA